VVFVFCVLKHLRLDLGICGHSRAHGLDVTMSYRNINIEMIARRRGFDWMVASSSISHLNSQVGGTLVFGVVF